MLGCSLNVLFRKAEIGSGNPDDGAFGTMSGSGHSALRAESSGGGNQKSEFNESTGLFLS